MKKLAILGAGGHGRVVADAAEASGWKQIDFFDDLWPQKTVNGVWNIIGNKSLLLELLPDYDGVIVAIGNNTVRAQYLQELMEHQAPLVNIIHPKSIISTHATLGIGIVVFAGAIINPMTHVGDGVIINTGATIDHDCIIEDGVHICPGVSLAGGVVVGHLTWVGIGTCVKEYTHIGKNCMIGAGAVVVKPIGDNKIAYGVPATLQGTNHA